VTCPRQGADIIRRENRNKEYEKKKIDEKRRKSGKLRQKWRKG
jgi:hypothetical protein